MLRTAIGFFLLVQVWNVHAQSGYHAQLLYPEKLREDTEVLRALIHGAHPDPYRYATKAELDARIDRLVAGLSIPVPVDQYMDSLMPVFRMIGDAHCHPEPGAEEMDRLQHRAPLIPLRVRALSSGLYVDEELKGFRSLPLAARIISINGIAIERILGRMGEMVVSDGANTTLGRYLIERDFPLLLNRVMGDTSVFKLRFEHGGSEEERIVFAMTGDEIARSRKPVGSEILPWRAEWLAESGTVWVTLSTFEKEFMERTGQNEARFISAVLEEIERNNARTVVIDVRGASGGEPRTAELVFSAFAKEPFNALRRSGAIGPNSRSAQVGPRRWEEGTLLMFTDGDPLGPRVPMENAFTGRAYVIADGGTCDAAALLVMLAKRTGRARVVGEETGSNAARFTGGGETLTTLPNSRIVVHVPLLIRIPQGEPSGPADHGEFPTNPLEQQIWGIAKGRDTVKETVLRMLSEMQ